MSAHDVVEIVRRRLANGYTIADHDVHKLIATVDAIKASNAELAFGWADADEKLKGMTRAFLAEGDARKTAWDERDVERARAEKLRAALVRITAIEDSDGGTFDAFDEVRCIAKDALSADGKEGT